MRSRKTSSNSFRTLASLLDTGRTDDTSMKPARPMALMNAAARYTVSCSSSLFVVSIDEHTLQVKKPSM